MEDGLKQAHEQIQQLTKELEQETSKNGVLKEELNKLKVEAQSFSQIKKEKDALALQVEEEEEFLTNTLQRKLKKLLQEKVDLETELEIEEEYLVNKLQKQLKGIELEKDKMKIEMESVRKQMHEFKKQCDSYTEKNENLKKELSQLKNHNFLLQQKIQEQKQRLTEITNKKLELERLEEITAERRFNIEATQRKKRSLSLDIPKLGSNNNVVPTASPPTGPLQKEIPPMIPRLRGRSVRSRSPSRRSVSPSPIPSPRASRKCLKKGFLKATKQNENQNLNQKKPLKLYFALYENGSLEAYDSEFMNELFDEFSVNMDLVSKISIDEHKFWILLVTSQKPPSRFCFACERAEDCQEWFDWMLQLAPAVV
eukprot:TRINITY_DN1863_c0_g1_i1.p1 TRINITY_DN1863_c0_g1~~TRINITY_DN1863_c0_g1_i1.p1  ORF type:complete len:369 (+),score=90.38 TRINITY_DN1863_c0_g1_i1:81-1187(+)